MLNISVGDKLYGFCNGWFRDSTEEKTVEAVGKDWVVVRDERDEPYFGDFHGRNMEQINDLIVEWKDEYREYR